MIKRRSLSVKLGVPFSSAKPALVAVMLLKLAFLVSFIALCAAQERPYFPTTFTADEESVVDYIDREGSHRMVGQGKRLETSNKELHSEMTHDENSPEGETDYHYSLYRYDLGLEFHYDKSSNTPFTRCRADQLFGDLYPYFDWVQYADYSGQRAMGEETIDFWSVMVGPDKHEVGVNPLNVNVPVYYLHHHEYENRTVYHKFTNFEPTEAPDTEFEIPDFCQQEFKEKMAEMKTRPKARRT